MAVFWGGRRSSTFVAERFRVGMPDPDDFCGVSPQATRQRTMRSGPASLPGTRSGRPPAAANKEREATQLKSQQMVEANRPAVQHERRLLLHKRPLNHKITRLAGIALVETARLHHAFEIFEHGRAAANHHTVLQGVQGR